MTSAARTSAFELGDSLCLEGDAPPPPRGALEDLARLGLLRELRLYGQGVAVAVVDDGIYRESVQIKLRTARLMDHGAFPLFDVDQSRVMGAVEPFSRTRRSHGSMCAYDACLAAPGCTLLDFPILAPRAVGVRRLNDILAAYRRVVDLLRVGAFRHIVVINAWQALPGDERCGLATDDPGHPLYQALSELDAAGADVLFAAPDHHARQIHGPALHPQVLTVTAVNLDGTPFESSVERAGPAGSGKPDVSNYQGFVGYELFRNQGDYGTSAATALTAGLIAAVRSAPKARAKPPRELRRLFRQSATREPGSVNGPGIADVAHVLNEL
jgi:hypothetical protein